MATEINEKRRRFERGGPVAVRATAIGVLLDCDGAEGAPDVSDGVATVTIRGPLVQFAGMWWDSYEAVLARVTEACRSEAKAVILKIHSPGGDVFGTFETARAMRALFAAAGKESVAYVEGEACSAAYALACSCDKIVVTSTSMIGSVGVINTIVSQARANDAQGLDVVLVTSGARKADGNPLAPISDGAIAANQAMVDALAAEFFRWVSEARGLDAAPLEAGVYVGAQAVEVGLADEISDESNLRASLARGTSSEEAKPMPAATQAQAKGPTMSDQRTNSPKAASSYEDAIAAVAKAAEEGDERARKALKHLAKAADEGDDKDGDEGEKKDAKAESGGEDKKDDDKDEKKEAKASAQASSSVSLDAEIRAGLIASRPDLVNDAKLQAKFAVCDLAELERAVKMLPKAEFKAPAQPEPGTRGASQKDGRMVPSGKKDELAARMGILKGQGPKVTKDPTGVTVFGGSPEQVEIAINSYHAMRSTKGSA